jgi:DNA transformation protein
MQPCEKLAHMGTSGERQSSAGEDRAARLVEALAPLGHVTSKKMFGGHGIFVDSVMFALIDSSGTAHLRADDTTEPGYVQRGSSRHSRMPYWQIPTEILESDEDLLEWGSEAAAIAKSKAKPKSKGQNK